MDAVAGAVATPVVKDAYNKVKKSADYVIAYKDYLIKYKEQRAKLISKQTDIKALVADGERKGERVLDEVDKWLAWVEEFLKPPDKKEGEKRGGLEFVLASLVVTPAEKNEQVAGEKSRFWKEPKMRHNLSKMAEEKANAIREKINEINSRGTQVTIPRGPSKYGPSVEGDFFTELKSREELLKQIMNTLKADKTNKIGIHGMGGAGKSTLVQEIAKRAENEMSFNAVIIAEISRVPNIKHIQDQIAGRIGLPLDSFGTKDRASRLYDMLKKIKRQRDDTSREQREEGGVPSGTSDKKREKGGDQRAFHVGAISRQLKKKTYQKYTVISLASDHNYEYPASLSLPKLKVLRLQDATRSRLCDNYFSMMEKLKVLDLANSNIRTFPRSIEQLRSLKTLLLENCLLEDISRICKLVKLQVLNLKGSNIEELPKELGNLVRLRLLDLTSCKHLKIIHAGMFTTLTLLEGLYMRDSFSNWRPKEDMASLSELECCVCLQVLEVQITSSEQLAKGDFVIPNLSSFKINFGNSKWKKDVSSLSRYLQVNHVAYCDLDKEGWKAVMKKAKTIVLEGIDHSLSNVSSARARGGEKVGMSSVLNVFPNDLQKFTLFKLSGFDCAMPVHYANRLKLLEVRKCENLEYIFKATKELDLIELPCLEELFLSDLGSFRGLCMRSSKERDRMLKPLFTKQVTFPRLAKLKLELMDNIDNLWDMTSEKEFTQTVSMLQSIQLEHLPNLKNVWNMEMYERSYNFKYFEQLKSLTIRYCDAMKQVISVGARCEDESISGQTITFSSLSTLNMERLPSLTCFYEGSLCMEFSALKELELAYLDKLETFAKPAERLNRKESEENNIALKKALFISGKALFPSLEKLTVYHVNSIEELCSSKHDLSKELKKIDIRNCSSIKTVCPPWVAIELQQLESLYLNDCDNLVQVVSTELESQMVTSSIPNGTISFSSLSEFRAAGMNKLACFYLLAQ